MRQEVHVRHRRAERGVDSAGEFGRGLCASANLILGYAVEELGGLRDDRVGGFGV
jgi:hypothetical protein